MEKDKHGGTSVTEARPRPWRTMQALCVMALILFAFAALAPGLTPVAAAALTFGLHVDDPDEVLPLHVRVAQFTGANAMTVQFVWDEVERVPGRFVWSAQEAVVAAAREQGMRIVGVLSYPPDLPLAVERTPRTGWPSGHVDDWTFFVSSVVTRFSKNIDAWVIASGAERGGDGLFTAAEAEIHAEFARLTAEAVRSVAPRAQLFVVTPAADVGWLGLFAYYGGMTVVDGLALDLHRWPSAPTGLSAVVDDVRMVAQTYEESPLLWAWQFGYPTHRGISVSEPRWRGVTRERQAAWLVQSHVLLASAGIDTVFYDELINRGPNPSDALHNFGLHEWTGDPKPAATSYTVMTNMLHGLHYARPGDVIERPVLPPEFERQPGPEQFVADGGAGTESRAGSGGNDEDPDRDEYEDGDGPDVIGPEERASDVDALDEADDAQIRKPYHFVFNYEQFTLQTNDAAFAVTGHVLTGDPSTVIVVWAEPAAPGGGCRHGCGHVDILRWLDGVPVRVFDMWGEPVLVQSDLRVGDAPLYIELPMELVP